jgi:hypothetical protein
MSDLGRDALGLLAVDVGVGQGHVAAAPPIRVMRSRQRTPALLATANKVADLDTPRRVPELLNTFAM